MKIAGVDPGINGAIAILDEKENLIFSSKLPTIQFRSKKVLDGHGFAHILKSYSPDIVVIEDVHAMPKQGVVSMFRFGEAKGLLIGICIGLGFSLFLVKPATWHKHFQIGPDDAFQFVKLRMRGLCNDKHVADAICIALWYIEHHRNSADCLLRSQTK